MFLAGRNVTAGSSEIGASRDGQNADRAPSGVSSTFGTTHWTVVLEAGAGDSPAASQALERLCTAYWYPLYAYARRQGNQPQDSQDLVQDFFAQLLERNYLRLADRSRGRFRTFLLSGLQRFLINEWRKNRRIKRGGGQTIVSWDEITAEERYAGEPAIDQPADSLYDHRWAATLLERAWAGLKAEFEKSGRIDQFERLKSFVWGDKSSVSYAEIGERLGMSESAVKMAVRRLRQRFGEFLRAEVAQTVATPGEIDEELRYLISVIRAGMGDSPAARV